MALFAGPTSGDPITMGANGKLDGPRQPDRPVHRGRRHRPRHLAREPARVRRGGREGLRRQAQDRLVRGLAGEKAFNQSSNWLPDETVEAFRKYLVGIKGPLTTPVGGGIRSLNVALRQMLDLYVCLRPVRWFKGVPSPVKRPGARRHGDLPREHRGHLRRHRVGRRRAPRRRRSSRSSQNEMKVKKIRFPETSGIGIKPVSREGTERLVRAAIEYALEIKRKSVTLVHKGNIMKFTEGAFRDWGYALASASSATRSSPSARAGSSATRRRTRTSPSRRTRARSSPATTWRRPTCRPSSVAEVETALAALADARRRQVEEEAPHQGLASPTSRSSRCSRARRSSTSSRR